MMETFSPLTGAAIVYAVQTWFKQFPAYHALVAAFPGADKWAHRTVALLLSLGTGMGIALLVEGDWSHGWKFSGTIPPGWTLMEGLWHSFEVFCVQNFAYHATNKPVEVIPGVVHSTTHTTNIEVNTP